MIGVEAMLDSDDDEQTPDFEDLLAAYNLSDNGATAATNAESAGRDAGAGISGEDGGSASLGRPSGSSSASFSLSILKEMARMEPPITDGSISIHTPSTEIVVKENGIVDFRKPACPPKSGGKPANMQRMILDLAQRNKSKSKSNARKTTSSSSKSLLMPNGSRTPTTATKAIAAKKSVAHLGPTNGQRNRRAGQLVNRSTANIPASVSRSSGVAENGFRNGPGSLANDDNDDGKLNSLPFLNDLIEEASQQLYTCVLPPYVPKTSTTPFQQGRGEGGHPCLDCSDRFLMEASLTTHLERRSIHITFDCKTCKKEIVFHNRCSLLGHIRTHKERNQPTSFGNIKVRPLQPAEFIEESPSLENNDTEDKGNDSSNNSGNRDSQYQCNECKLHCGSSLSLQEHFGYSRSLGAMHAAECMRCHSRCPTKCSLAAHMRMHDRRRPFMCPECGLLVAESWDVFQRHLSTVCMHLSRTTGYECPTSSCEALYNTPVELSDHIVECHGDSLHKCQGCPMAFRSRDSFEVHRLEKHASGLDSAVECRTVSKCPLCDVVFQNTDAFRTHLATHAESLERDLRFIYQCSVCKLLLAEKHMLVRHLKRTHPSIFKMRCQICGSAFRDLYLLLDHMRQKHPEKTKALKEIEEQEEESKMELVEEEEEEAPQLETEDTNSNQGLLNSELSMVLVDGDDQHLSSSNISKEFECKQCHRSFHSVLGLKMHLLRSHSADDKRSWCAVCSEYLPDPKEMARHGHMVHVEAGQLVCTLCNNVVFATKFGLAKHLDQHSDGLTYPLDCVYCDQSLEDPKAAANHWKSEHRLFRFTCDQCDAQYLQENSFLRHKRCAHGEGDASKKYYRCSMCEDVDFAKRSNLVHHLENKHGIPKSSIDLTQLVSTQCSPAKLPERVSPMTSTPTPAETPPPPPPPPPSKKKKKRKRKKEGKRDRRKRSSRSSSSKSKKTSSGSKRQASKSAEAKVASVEAKQPEQVSKQKRDNDRDKGGNDDDDEGDRDVAADDDEATSPPEKKLKLEATNEKEEVENHTCAKCDFEATTRSTFVEHIRQHKKVGENNYQCLECGICFVVEPSLRKHLTYAHKVKDVDRFMSDKGYPTYVTSCNGTIIVGSVLNAPESPDKEHRPSASISSNEQQQQRIFQCDVCRNIFDTELSLRTHMRTHGMAFLKIKRVSNVTVNEISKNASPQKK